MTDFFTDRTTAVLTTVLNGTASRQRALAGNIANAETPGFHRQDVDFATQLSIQVNQPDADPDDVIAAHAAGMRAVAVGWTLRPREELLALNPEAFIETAGELLELFSLTA